MNIDIKKSTKLVNYTEAIDFLEKRLIEVNQNKSNELIWILEHPSTYPAGTGFDGHRKMNLNPLVDPVEMDEEENLLLASSEPVINEPNPLIG